MPCEQPGFIVHHVFFKCLVILSEELQTVILRTGMLMNNRHVQTRDVRSVLSVAMDGEPRFGKAGMYTRFTLCPNYEVVYRRSRRIRS